MTKTLEAQTPIKLSASDRADIARGIPVLAAEVNETLLEELRWYANDWTSKGRIRRWASRRDATLRRLPETGPYLFIGEELYRVIDVIDTAKTLADTKGERVEWARRRDALRAAITAATVTVAEGEPRRA